MLTLVSAVDKKEQGIIGLLQSLSKNKKAEKAVSNLTSAGIYTENGLNLSEKLDTAFQTEDVEDEYIFFKSIHLKRHCDISMNDYITEFENLYHLMRKSKHEITQQSSCFQIIRWGNNFRKSGIDVFDVSGRSNV